MDKYRQILLKYWGYSSFRDLQEDIIYSVAEEKKDTLALMPTGGGKSITFQVPAIAMDGICLVVTPLIALMKDQVENLQKKGIKALMIHSGMRSKEIEIMLDNALFGDYKFLYLSPERLKTEMFSVRLQKMNVSLIAVDESHCISQWGYDFRPSYLEIAEIRTQLPNVPVLALTATATPKVAEDIMNKLNFRKHNLLKKSFERKNLTYIVRNVEDKFVYLLRILNKQKGTGIVYVRSRGATKDIAERLSKQGIISDFYHAGLSPELRSAKQDDWIAGRTRIIVATNAFGMGIDKPDVRVVVHMDLPESTEAYFQEAGRAGRDEKRSYAILLYNKTDKVKFEQRFRNEFPSIEQIKNIYQLSCSYLQVAYRTGKGQMREFDVISFSKQFKFYPTTVFSAFKFLAHENIAELTEEINNPSRLFFTINRDDLYKIQINNPELDRFIKVLLRAYTGLFSNFVNIDENYLAKLIYNTRDYVYSMLVKLNTLKIAEYIPQKKSPMLILHEERLDEKNVRISPDNFQWAKNRFTERMDAMLSYAETSTKCRSSQLLSYFGEKETFRCGQCDVCKERNELDMSKYEFDLILEYIKTSLKDNPLSMEELLSNSDSPEKTIKVIRWLLDNEKISQDKHLLKWT